MNDPMSRKLFQSREAREKLRGMGGIMASSPELAQTVARFQDGGGVTVPVVPTYSEWLNMSRTERRRAGLPESFIGGQMYFNRFGVGMGTNDPETGLPNITMEEAAAGEFGSLPPTMTEQGGTVEEPLPGQGIFPPDIAFDIGQAVGFGPALEAAGVEDPAAVRQRRAEEEPEQLPQEVVETVQDAAESLDSDEVETLDTEFQQLMDADQRLTQGDGDPDPDDLEALAQRRIELYRRLFGEDEPTPRDKNMQLAMIGLAIAAGQSPDALTNIAQGALTGLQAVSAEDRARRDRERELRTAAVSGVLSEQADARKETLAQRQERIERYNKGRQEILVAALSDTTALAINDPAERYAYAEQVADQWARSNFPDLVSAPAVPATTTVPQQPTRARNPQTGEVLVLRGGQWVPE